MAAQEDRVRLSQAHTLNSLRRTIESTEMVTVCLSDGAGSHNHGIYCGFIPSSQIEHTLASPTWNLMHGHGLPGAVEYYEGGEKRVDYLRFGDDHGVEPLVIDREFHGIRPDYVEISEEFRLFYELYHDHKLDHYIKIDGDGNEQLVAVVEPKCVQIRLKEIRQFLAIKEMHLSIQFDCREFSDQTLQDLGLSEGGGDQRDGLVPQREAAQYAHPRGSAERSEGEYLAARGRVRGLRRQRCRQAHRVSAQASEPALEQRCPPQGQQLQEDRQRVRRRRPEPPHRLHGDPEAGTGMPGFLRRRCAKRAARRTSHQDHR